MSYNYHATAPGVRTGLTLQQPTGSWAVTETPDAAKRLASVVSPAGTFSYAYPKAGSVWTNLALPNGAAITNAYDTSGRLTGTYLRTNASVVLNKQLYQYNQGNQRTLLTRSDASTVTYTYDPIGQLTRALGNGGQSPENLGYGFDTAWNVAKRTNGAAVTTFNVDGKNQLTSLGSGWPTFAYDGNGNLTAETGMRQFTYDAENQLIRVNYTGGYWQVEFVYDGRGRLRRRIDYTWSGSNYIWNGEGRYVYDGMRVIQERNNGNTPTVSYTRGLDLSGSLEGAGGIGGLLSRSDQYSGGSMTRHAAYFADGNGNVINLIDAGAAHTIWAAYRYQPWGQSLQATGILATANVYRFSSKEWLPTPGLYYYGYRFYEPNLQRWVNRDPVGERGGINQYEFADNQPVQTVDPLGWSPSLNPQNQAWACEALEAAGQCVARAPKPVRIPVLPFVWNPWYDWTKDPRYNYSAPLPIPPKATLPAPNPGTPRLPNPVDPAQAKAQQECLDRVSGMRDACRKRGNPLTREETLKIFEDCMEEKGFPQKRR